MIELTESLSALVFRPLLADDPMQRQPDISPADQRVSWEPKDKSKEGLRDTIAYFDELLSGTQ